MFDPLSFCLKILIAESKLNSAALCHTALLWSITANKENLSIRLIWKVKNENYTVDIMHSNKTFVHTGAYTFCRA